MFYGAPHFEKAVVINPVEDLKALNAEGLAA